MEATFKQWGTALQGENAKGRLGFHFLNKIAMNILVIKLSV